MRELKPKMPQDTQDMPQDAPQAENELFQARLDKLARLRERGVDPYPRNYPRTHTTRQALALFADAEAQAAEGEDASTSEVCVAGRMVGFRGMGRASFADLLDGEGRLQVMFRRNALGDMYGMLRDLDIGDWLGARGSLFRTRMGEVTLQASEFTLLCKSLRPLPEKWHGLQDVELRFRQRYLDLIANPDARRVAIMRSRIVSAIRRHMETRGYLEVETPILVPVAAGAWRTRSPRITICSRATSTCVSPPNCTSSGSSWAGWSASMR